MKIGIIRTLAIASIAMAYAQDARAGVPAPPAAPPAASQPSPRSLELARQLMTAMHMEVTFSKMMQSIMPQIWAQIEQQATSLTEEQRNAIHEATLEASGGMMRQLIERAIPIYAQVYTEDELAGIVAFYGSPAGQAMIAKSPEVAARLAPSLQDIMPGTQAEILRRTCAKIDCTGVTGKARAPRPS